jgi:hypothetical protein
VRYRSWYRLSHNDLNVENEESELDPSFESLDNSRSFFSYGTNNT